MLPDDELPSASPRGLLGAKVLQVKKCHHRMDGMSTSWKLKETLNNDLIGEELQALATGGSGIFFF